MASRALEKAGAYEWGAVTDRYLEVYRAASGVQGVPSLMGVSE